VKQRDRLSLLVASLAVIVAALGAAAAVIALAGYDVGDSAEAAFRGAFGGPFAVLSATLKRATPLLFLGVSVAIAFRAGVLNIGGEGQLLAGATAAVAVALALPAETPAVVFVFLEVAVGAAAGALWAIPPAWLRSRFKVSEVVSTLLLNFVALNLVGFLIRGPLQEPSRSYPQSAEIPLNAQLPILIPGQRLHLGFLLAILAAVGTWFVLRRTAAGFRLLAAGANPDAARSAGRIDVSRVQSRALIASGALAGLAGASEASGVTFFLYENLSPGYGYTAIAVALLGGLNPSGIFLAAVFFGALGAGADTMQRDAGVPPEFASVVAAVVLLGLLAAPVARKRLLATRSAGAA
jgi:ABC-type uncharacterized transport system permease subunit